MFGDEVGVAKYKVRLFVMLHSMKEGPELLQVKNDLLEITAKSPENHIF